VGHKIHAWQNITPFFLLKKLKEKATFKWHSSWKNPEVRICFLKFRKLPSFLAVL
jgi:hypothetical protein